MGIVNVTPNSFSDGGRYFDLPAALAHGRTLVAEGAAILDVGGESSRPGSDPVDLAEELARVIPLIATLHREFPDLKISVDTYKAETARQALRAGACIVNDISALRLDPGMAEVVAAHRAGLILMHMQGLPKTMQLAPRYGDVVGEVTSFLIERRDFAVHAGIRAEAIAVDPGFGFGKTMEHNLTLLRSIKRLTTLGRPVVAGISKKSTLARLLGNPALPMTERVWPSVAFTSYLREQGVNLFRVHDVRLNFEALRMTEAIMAP
ncbi:MAG TPA: dihydropteroate synthase [Chthoniobacterales bacterium]